MPDSRMTKRSWVVALVAAASLMSCAKAGAPAGTALTGSGATCASTPECSAGQVCLGRLQACATRCDNDAQCAPGQRCSGGGGCVSQGACGSDIDCSGGQVCSPTGACEAPCTAQSCEAGKTCGPAGHCIVQAAPGGGGGGGGSSTTPAAPAPTCGGELFNSAKVEANFLTLFDKSGSMDERSATGSKWQEASSAVNQLVSAHEATIRFGLNLFPVGDSRGTECTPEQISVPIGDRSAAAFAKEIGSRKPGGKTPLGDVLTSAKDVQGLKDAARSNFVLLVTDGKETCGGDALKAVKSLFAEHIKTYVIGFGREVDGRVLNNLAEAGGTARASTPRYFQADDPATLSSSLASIVRGVVGCDFKLVTDPPDLAKVFVYVNGQLAARDPKRVNGWDYAAANHRLTLYGSACEQISNSASAKVSTVYGCPDISLVEGAPGTTCSANGQCLSNQCKAGVCTGGLPGQACIGNDECLSHSCKSGFCEGGTPALPNGAACQNNSQCASNQCSAQGFCEGSTTGLPGGSPCTSPTQCRGGICQQGVCGLPGGSACQRPNDCASNTCLLGLCEGSTPTTGKPDGSPCTTNPECASQLCSAGTCQTSIN